MFKCTSALGAVRKLLSAGSWLVSNNLEFVIYNTFNTIGSRRTTWKI